jgi:adenylate kinase
LKFPWHAREGVLGNIRKLNEEFNTFRGLNPVKIFVTGPPACGKTFYSEKVADYYNIPRIHVKQMVDEVYRLADQEEGEIDEEDEFGTQVREKIGELRTEEVEKQEAARGDAPEEMEDGWPDIDPKSEQVTAQIRIPDKFLYKLLQDKLRENAARNRGYVLDGFPRTHDDA